VSELKMGEGEFYRGRQFCEHIVGQPHIRDTDYPCDVFTPCTYGAGTGQCSGDGHYMCRECEEHNEALFVAIESGEINELAHEW